MAISVCVRQREGKGREGERWEMVMAIDGLVEGWIARAQSHECLAGVNQSDT